jgi:hypothetical protein
MPLKLYTTFQVVKLARKARLFELGEIYDVSPKIPSAKLFKKG